MCCCYLMLTCLLPDRTHSGVCHSDLAIMLNGWPQLPFPTEQGQVGGHEGVGVVVKMGPGTEGSAVKVGDRVGVKWVAHICGSCRKWLFKYQVHLYEMGNFFVCPLDELDARG